MPSRSSPTPNQKEKKAFVDTIEGYAKTKTWLIDLRGDRVLLTGKTVTGKSTANNMTGSQRQVRAVEWAIREALKEIAPVARS